MVQDFVSLVINLDCSMLNLTIINQSIKLYLSSCYAATGDLSKIEQHLSNNYLPVFKKKKKTATLAPYTVTNRIRFKAHSNCLLSWLTLAWDFAMSLQYVHFDNWYCWSKVQEILVFHYYVSSNFLFKQTCLQPILCVRPWKVIETQ